MDRWREGGRKRGRERGGGKEGKREARRDRWREGENEREKERRTNADTEISIQWYSSIPDSLEKSCCLASFEALDVLNRSIHYIQKEASFKNTTVGNNTVISTSDTHSGMRTDCNKIMCKSILTKCTVLAYTVKARNLRDLKGFGSLFKSRRSLRASQRPTIEP